VPADVPPQVGAARRELVEDAALDAGDVGDGRLRVRVSCS
jgi:hypothetical protein